MTIRIVLDAMGSDQRPEPELQAAARLAMDPDLELTLAGDQSTLEAGFQRYQIPESAVKIAHAPQTLEMSDHIAEARAKRENSMQVGMSLVKAGHADAFLTAGNTGMGMYFGRKVFGMLPGVDRPCLAATFPVKGGLCVIADIGANADCRPEFLLQFAQMGAVYTRLMLNLPQPRIGLLANGEEEGKGNELVKNTYPLLKAAVPGFVGNVESKEVFGGQVDLAVTDGFTGNILLKSAEGVAKLLLDTLKAELLGSVRTKIGAALAKPAFVRVKALMDPDEFGAVPLLGLDGLVFIGHGRSDAKALVSAVNQVKNAVKAGLLPSLRSELNLEKLAE